MNPVLDENVTVQEYLEAEARKQVQSIKVSDAAEHLNSGKWCVMAAAQTLQAKCEQQASELQEAWQKHKAELMEMKASL